MRPVSQYRVSNEMLRAGRYDTTTTATVVICWGKKRIHGAAEPIWKCVSLISRYAHAPREGLRSSSGGNRFGCISLSTSSRDRPTVPPTGVLVKWSTTWDLNEELHQHNIYTPGSLHQPTSGADSSTSPASQSPRLGQKCAVVVVVVAAKGLE